LILAVSAQAADEGPKVSVASGDVVSIDKDALVLKPRGADGKFSKEITLKLTGTSTFSQLSSQTRGGKTVLVQKMATAKDVAAKEHITLIYATSDKDLVLLVAVIQAP
jgi:hypothetical protein